VSHDKDVDPVGACVGIKGMRVQSVVQELRGEKIDIIPWTDDQVQFVRNALSPAKVARVFMNNEERAMQVVVPNDQLSLAIGKRGQNVRLAAKLTHWKIDIMSEDDADVDTERLEALRQAELAFQSPRNKLVAESEHREAVSPEADAAPAQSVAPEVTPAVLNGDATPAPVLAPDEASALEDDAVSGPTAEASAEVPPETSVGPSAPSALDDQPESDKPEG
jgi:N utilization substance protein A